MIDRFFLLIERIIDALLEFIDPPDVELDPEPEPESSWDVELTNVGPNTFRDEDGEEFNIVDGNFIVMESCDDGTRMLVEINEQDVQRLRMSGTMRIIEEDT